MFGRKAREIARLRAEVAAWRRMRIRSYTETEEEGRRVRSMLLDTSADRLALTARYGQGGDVARLFGDGQGFPGLMVAPGCALEVEIGPIPQPWMASDEPR